MTTPSVSVIVVSRGRAALLERCMMGLSQLLYAPFEIVVVADAEGLAALSVYDGKIKTVLFEAANISKARNLGIAQASGEVVAFIDDDAVPEPTWLAALVRGFQLPSVTAVGGYVRGRNGISFQWKAGAIDQTGQRVETASEEEPFVPDLPNQSVAKLEGTNMAIKRKTLLALGGFDPAFEYYLDETDLCMRLAKVGEVVAFAPGAEVHHGFAQNVTRSANRAPKDLFQLGASKAAFLRKHTDNALHDAALAAFSEHQHRRLLMFMHYGFLEPRDIGPLMQTLRNGFAEGQQRDLKPLRLEDEACPFLPYESSATGASVLLAGRVWQRGWLRKEARQYLSRGDIVTLFLFGPSLRRHHVRFEAPGIWVQSGGLWGRSDRTTGPHLTARFRTRVARERSRCLAQRAFSEPNG